MKRNILIFTSVYLPGYKAGGPIRSISNIVDLLSDSFNFYIITSDRDIHDTKPYSDIKIGEWNKVGKGYVYYTNKLSISLITSLIKERQYHLLYLNSFFSYRFSLLPLLTNNFIDKSERLKVCLAPRGEFSPGALKIKYYKKALFIYLTRFLSVYKGVLWHASNDFEKQDIIHALKTSKLNVKVAPNVPSSYKDVSYKSVGFNGVLKMVFISRVSPKKNIDYALKVLSQVNVKVEYHIYGVIDDNNYWEKCQAIIDELPSNVKVRYMGTIPHSHVPETLSKYDVFYMPTKGENYGHAIVEAFLAGVPVLISNTTPWRMLEEKGVGWDIPLEAEQKYINTIESFYKNKLNGFDFEKGNIKDWILHELNFTKVEMLNRKLFS